MSVNEDRLIQEKSLVAGLIQEPRRLMELSAFKLQDFECHEVRLVLLAARKRYDSAASKGLIRFASAEGLEKILAETLKGGDTKEKRRRNTGMLASTKELLDEVAGYPYQSDHDFAEAVDQAKEYATDTKLRLGLASIIEDIQRGKAADVHTRLIGLARDVSPRASLTAHGEIREDAGQVLAEYYKAKRDPGGGRIPTPIPWLNKVTSGGLKAGRMWLVAAYTGDGKTQISKEIVYNAAVNHGKNGLIVTSEQSKKDIELMLAVRHTHAFVQDGLDFNKVEKGELNAKEERVLVAAIKDLETNTHYGRIKYIQTPGGTTIGEVKATMDGMRAKYHIDVAMLDHSMLFRPSERQESEVGNLSRVIMETKQIALDYDSARGLSMILCHQIKVDGWERAQSRGYYVLSDLAGTSEAARSSDLVLWSFRNDELRDLGELRLGIAKDRHGPGETKGREVMEMFRSSAIFPIEDE